jgi:hypothetical protein
VVDAGNRVDELRADAQPIAAAADAAFEHVPHTELTGDLGDVDGAGPVGKGGVSGDDEQPPDPRQTCDQILGETVDEIVLIAIAAHVLKRQDSDRGTIWQREGRRRAWACIGVRHAGGSVLAHLANEAQTLARQGLDQPLPGAAVADGAARGIDPVEDRRFRYEAATPDRGQKLILADDPVPVPDQVDEEIEDLRLDRGQGAVPAQLPAIQVENTVLE